MSRKHFLKLAAAISTIEDAADRKRMADLIGLVCSECNARFEWITWYAHCHIESE